MISICIIHGIYTIQMKWQELNKIKYQEKSKHKSAFHATTITRQVLIKCQKLV